MYKEFNDAYILTESPNLLRALGKMLILWFNLNQYN